MNVIRHCKHRAPDTVVQDVKLILKLIIHCKKQIGNDTNISIKQNI